MQKKYLSLEVLLWTDDEQIKDEMFYNRKGVTRKSNMNYLFNYKFGRNQIYQQLNSFRIKNSNDYVTFSVPSDNFTNQTIMHMIIDNILSKHQIYNYLYQYDAFFCTDKLNKAHGFNITENANEGTLYHMLEDLSNYVVDDEQKFENMTKMFDDMLEQILLPLYILHHPKYAFVHSDLKSRNIFVKSYTEGGVKKYVYKIADFDKSSITWNGVRFYNEGDETVRSQYLIKDINTLVDWSTSSKTYCVSSAVTELAKMLPKLEMIELESIATRYSPIPFYSSYDIYTLFFSIMYSKIAESYVKYAIEMQKDCKLVKALKFIFTHDQFNMVAQLYSSVFAKEKK